MTGKSSPSQPTPLSSYKKIRHIKSLNQQIELDILFACERDVAFAIRLAQHRYKSHRPCIVQVNSNSHKWRQTSFFSRCNDIVVVSDQTLVEPNKTYFVDSSHVLDKKNGSFWIIKRNHSNQNLCDSLRPLLADKKVLIGDLIFLKNAQFKHLLTDFPTQIGKIWYEGEPNSWMEINPLTEFATRSEIALKLCNRVVKKVTTTNNNDSVANELNEDATSNIEEKLLNHLHRFSQIDYQHYRQSWLAKYVQQRCTALGLKSTKSYVSYCESHLDEWQQLELLAFPCQTNPDQFNAAYTQLKQIYESGLLNELIQTHPGLRFWVPNSAMGEAAYALSLVWQESNTAIPVKIFATDISNQRVESSSKGLFAESLANSECNTSIKRYYGKQKGSHQSLPFLRKQITFSCHDLLNTPGFNHLHFIHAQAILENYKEPAQRQILATFNHCLVDGGLLWLDSIDINHYEQFGFTPVAGITGLFKKISQVTMKIDAQHSQNVKNFQRKYYAPPQHSLLSYHKRRNRYSDYHNVLDLLIDKYLPAGLLIDMNGILVHVFGNVSEYLEPFHEGIFSNDISNLLESRLSSKLTPHIKKLLKQKKEIQLTLPWDDSNTDSQLIVTLNFLQSSESEDAYCALFFEKESALPTVPDDEDSTAVRSYIRYIEKLESDLALLKENDGEDNASLRQEIEDLHIVISEVAAANEQMSLINEKLIKNYDSAMYSYEQCRGALNNGISSQGKIQPALAIINSSFKLQYFNDSMKLYLVDDIVEPGVDFHPYAAQIGGLELITSIKDCIKSQISATIKLPAMSQVKLVPLPNNEVLMKLSQIHHVKIPLEKQPTKIEA